MTQMITSQDLAKLTLELEVPAILSAMMNRHAPLTRDDEAILKRAFAPMNALETLMSLACCFHVLSAHMGEDAALTEPLLAQADLLLDDYAPYWMKDAFPADEQWIEYVADDLESLTELLCLLSDACHMAHPALSDACDLLQEVAYAQSLTADIIGARPLPAPLPAYADNVIRFPVERRV